MSDENLGRGAPSIPLFPGVEDFKAILSIAERIFRSKFTIEKHITNIYQKFDIPDRTVLMTNALRQGTHIFQKYLYINFVYFMFLLMFVNKHMICFFDLFFNEYFNNNNIVLSILQNELPRPEGRGILRLLFEILE
jgi:hypothetical protein